MYRQWVLTALLAWPALAALVVMVAPARWAKHVALAASLVEFAISAPLWWTFAPAGGFQFILDASWIPNWGIRYTVGVDGISLFMVLLTTFLVPLSVLGSYAYITTRERGFYALMLVLTTGMIGVFVALDLFLFYVMWEVMLIPMYFTPMMKYIGMSMTSDVLHHRGVGRQVRVRKRVHPGALANDGDEREDRHQHEERAKEGVHEELDGRVQTALPAPHPDDEVHRNEHDFPHHVKEEQIEGHEHPDHARREHEHQRIKAALARRDVGVAAEHRQRDQERREQDHKQRDPVHADRVADSPVRDPRRIEDELEAVRRRERPPQGRRDRELDQAGRERDVLGPARRRDHHDEGGERGPREQRGEYPLAVHGLPHRRADHGQDADDEQDHVHTHFARLQSAPQPPDGPRCGGGTVHEQAVHDSRVDDLREHFTREPHHRSHEDRVVQLVHVPLLPEQSGQAGLGRRESRRHECFRLEQAERAEDAQRSDQDRACYQSPLG